MKKKILLITITITMSAFLYKQIHAQQFMKLNKTDGTAEYYAINDIQKITFNELITGDPEKDRTTFKKLSYLKGFPNPSGNQFTLEYTLAEKTPVVIKIYTMKGELVKQVDQGNMNAGDYTFVWDDKRACPLADGTYHLTQNGTPWLYRWIQAHN